MDRCEELAAAYGRSPREVLRWPWVHVEECWASYVKRFRRTIKVDAMTKGFGPLGGSPRFDANAREPEVVKGDVQIGRVPDFVRSDWNKDGSKLVHHDRAWYAKPEVVTGQRPPTDEDNWDLPPTEIFKLAAKFPGAVQVVKT